MEGVKKQPINAKITHLFPAWPNTEQGQHGISSELEAGEGVERKGHWFCGATVWKILRGR